VAGRIRDDSIAEVREKARIEEVVSQYVTLRNAGGGSMKGLCPFHDEKSPSFHITPSRGFFHCLAGETGVLTYDGVVPIRDLAGTTAKVLNRHGDWVEAPFRSYGVQRLMRITMTRNRQRKEVFATDEHRWFVRAGQGGRSEKEAFTKDLRPGDRLVPKYPRSRIRRSRPSPFGVARGFTYGDGTRAYDGSRAQLCPPKDLAMLEWFPRSHTSTSGENVLVHDLPAYFKSLPPVDESTSYQHRRRFEANHKAFSRRGWVVESVAWSDRVEEVYCAEVEDGHAFTLEDNILTGNCFGCQEGGDVITFLMKIDALSFSEAVERLADKSGVALQREDGEAPERPKGPQRGRLIEAHKHAQAFYADQLGSPDALVARQFLAERGFDKDAAETFGIGFAPRTGEALYRHLQQKGFSIEELTVGGLVAVGRSPYDKFRGRLLWPIREPSGETIGFGARRIFDDDRIEAKYLNTAETPIYKKSHVLYGIDLARREIGRTSQAVIVEGYTDVMACHLSGVGTAVATCGTAFGDDHARVLRRFLHDHEEFRGEVIFTFDGDAAGQKAALRAFGGDQNFVSQTYVAVEPSGMDPCDLRMSTDDLATGEAAVRELVARRVPLYRFVIGNIIGKHDLDRADGRIDAMREAARVVASVRDQSKITAFAQEISKMIGGEVDPNAVLTEVRRAAQRPPAERGPRAQASAPAAAAAAPARPATPDLRDPRFRLERELLKLVVQHPMGIGRLTGDIGPDDFTHPVYRGIWEAVTALGGPAQGSGDPTWAGRLRDVATDPEVSSAVAALAVEPLLTPKQPDAAYVTHHVLRLLELTSARRIASVKSRLQRTNPVEEPEAYNRMFGELAALEQHRRGLRDQLVAGEGPH
jgi:DNA primase